MNNKTELLKIDTKSTTTPWDSRLPDIVQALGPYKVGEFSAKGLYVWTGEVKGTRVTLREPSGGVVELTIPEGAYQFTFSFDTNGRMYYGHGLGDEIVWTFFHDLNGRMETIKFKGEFPASAVDGRDNFPDQLIDVQLAYVKGQELCVRYQRQRYEEEHVVAKFSSKAKLRTIGISEDNRFIYRFYSNVGEVTSLQ